MASSAAGITLIALLGGMGMLPSDQAAQRPAAASAELSRQAAGARSVPAQLDPTTAVVAQAKAYQAQLRTERQQASDQSARTARELSEARAARVAKERADADPSGTGETATAAAEDVSLPPQSGIGRRAVFDMSAQRVWIVGSKGRVERSYLVSGSVLDNLDPGAYEVFSRSRHAVGVDDSGEMEYFVRFTRGKNAAIGFHSIPTQDGKPLQTRDQLGTPQSHGCIRQARPDAIAMWAFAQVGTKVVVTA